MSTIEFIKNVKKSNVRLWVLKNFDDNIIDVKRELKYGARYTLDGKTINEIWNLPPKDRLRVVSSKISIAEYGYEEVEPFIFKADFEVVGSSSGCRSVDTIKLELIDSEEFQVYDYKGMPCGTKTFDIDITTSNFVEFLNLLVSEPDNFKAIIEEQDGEYKLKGYSGVWMFDCNKSSLAIKPYTGVL